MAHAMCMQAMPADVPLHEAVNEAPAAAGDTAARLQALAGCSAAWAGQLRWMGQGVEHHQLGPACQPVPLPCMPLLTQGASNLIHTQGWP